MINFNFFAVSSVIISTLSSGSLAANECLGIDWEVKSYQEEYKLAVKFSSQPVVIYDCTISTHQEKSEGLPYFSDFQSYKETTYLCENESQIYHSHLFRSDAGQILRGRGYHTWKMIDRTGKEFNLEESIYGFYSPSNTEGYLTRINFEAVYGFNTSFENQRFPFTDIEEDRISYQENCTVKREAQKTELAFSSLTVLNPPALAFIEISYTRGKASLQPSFR